jgi:TusA-related sulfurtransferase
MKHSLDLRGMIIPFTMLKLSNGFRKMGAGEILEIIVANPDARKYILEILATLDCEVLGVHKGKDRYRIRLRKLGVGRMQKGSKKYDQRHVQEVTP